MIYFDHNATTPLNERVLEAMQPFLTQHYGNPSSLYRYGRLARTAIDMAREQVAALVGVSATQVIFTSGGTEANNLALKNVCGCLAVSAIEHPSVLETARHSGLGLQLITVNQHGVMELEQLSHAPQFVSMMLANNETGVIQPIADYAEQLRAKNVLVHTDAVQALGKIPVSFDQLNVDFMTLSSHKIYGAKGCGALIIGKNINPTPLIYGGGQEHNIRSGTENVASIVAFGKAAELAKQELTERHDYLLNLRILLEQQLKTIPNLTIFAEHSLRLPNTVMFGIDNTDGEMLVMQLDQKGIAVASGSACASGGSLPSHVLTAMGITTELAKTAVRVSLGMTNTVEEITDFIRQLKNLLPVN